MESLGTRLYGTVSLLETKENQIKNLKDRHSPGS